MGGAGRNGTGQGKGDREEKTTRKGNIIIAVTTMSDYCLNYRENWGISVGHRLHSYKQKR